MIADRDFREMPSTEPEEKGQLNKKDVTGKDIPRVLITEVNIEGLDGHPDVSIPGIEANTGSLGMGVSKAKGILWAKKYLKK